jgi:GntP family gluconate:H+ symporter
MPIIIPLLLLTGKSLVALKFGASDNALIKTVTLIGSPEVALLIGVFLSITLFEKLDKKLLNELADLAIEKAGPILAITSAGGVFGAVIKATGVGDQAGTYLGATGLGLFIPFIIAAFLKTAQGSSTVSIMTTASIIAPMLPALGLDSESGILLSTLAMGAGSMILSHANDSYFWVVTKFSDLSPDSTLKVFSTTTLIMGISAFISVWIASLIIM